VHVHVCSFRIDIRWFVHILDTYMLLFYTCACYVIYVKSSSKCTIGSRNRFFLLDHTKYERYYAYDKFPYDACATQAAHPSLHQSVNVSHRITASDRNGTRSIVRKAIPIKLTARASRRFMHACINSTWHSTIDVIDPSTTGVHSRVAHARAWQQRKCPNMSTKLPYVPTC
jgi:hypothetical protein